MDGGLRDAAYAEHTIGEVTRTLQVWLFSLLCQSSCDVNSLYQSTGVKVGSIASADQNRRGDQLAISRYTVLEQ